MKILQQCFYATVGILLALFVVWFLFNLLLGAL